MPASFWGGFNSLDSAFPSRRSSVSLPSSLYAYFVLSRGSLDPAFPSPFLLRWFRFVRGLLISVCRANQPTYEQTSVSLGA